MNGFEPSAQLRQSVEKGDVAFVREVLQALLNNNTCPDGEIRLALEWAAEKMPSLFDGLKPDVEPFRRRQQDWDSDYYYIQKAALWDDFSRERFEHLIAIRDCLRTQGVPEFRRVGAETLTREQPAFRSPSSCGGASGQKNEDKPAWPWGGIAVALCVIGVCALVGAMVIKRVR